MSPFQKLDSRNWPVVVCGQFRANPQLARSELFGHVKGAFTDAKEGRKGLLEQADGDSLFFDEIADIDQDTQRLLMSAIEGKGFSRLGDSAVTQSTFRFISATNRPLDVLRTECLDPDFYDRIAMFILTVPPLRQCKEDIPTIWKSVLARAGNDLDIDREEWNGFLEHSGLLKLILDSQLPGNIRDLQRLAYHVLAAIHAGKSEEDIVSVAMQCLNESVSSASPALSSTPEVGDFTELDGGLQQWLDDRERAWLETAMKISGGNKSKAADLVGMKRKTFEHHWKRMKLDE
jgi:DNA-binding NtrC family response regulator